MKLLWVWGSSRALSHGLRVRPFFFRDRLSWNKWRAQWYSLKKRRVRISDERQVDMYTRPSSMGLSYNHEEDDADDGNGDASATTVDPTVYHEFDDNQSSLKSELATVASCWRQTLTISLRPVAPSLQDPLFLCGPCG